MKEDKAAEVEVDSMYYNLINLNYGKSCNFKVKKSFILQLHCFCTKSKTQFACLVLRLFKTSLFDKYSFCCCDKSFRLAQNILARDLRNKCHMI